MIYQIEIHSPGSGSSKPIDTYTTPDPTEAFALALYYGTSGYSTLCTQQEEAPAEGTEAGA